MTELEAPSRGRLRDDPDFRRYWWSRVLSTGGTVVTLIALPVLVYRMTGSTLLTGVVSGLEAAPYLLFGLFAGVLADLFNRRRVMVVADVADALLMASIPAAHLMGVLSVPQILVVAFAGPGIAVFFDGANFGALPMLVGRDRIASANAVVFGASTALEMLLPSLVGVALAVLHPATLVGVDALSFAASAWCVSSISRPLHDPARVPVPLTGQAVRVEMREGLDYLFRHSGVRTMTVIGTLQCIAGGGFVALMVVWADRVLHVGTSGWRFGLVFTAWSMGALVASIALPRMLQRRSAAWIALTALPISGVLGVVTTLTGSWELGALLLFCWSVAYTLVTINAISYRQQVTPEHLLGRVNTAGRMLSWGIGWTLGAFLGGVLGNAFGIRAGMLVLTSAGLVAVVVAWTSPLRSQARGMAAPALSADDSR
ncbi:MAG: MFS transporter [Nocardioidaceae bacterium]